MDTNRILVGDVIQYRELGIETVVVQKFPNGSVFTNCGYVLTVRELDRHWYVAATVDYGELEDERLL